MLQDKFDVFCCLFYRTITSEWSSQSQDWLLNKRSSRKTWLGSVIYSNSFYVRLNFRQRYCSSVHEEISPNCYISSYHLTWLVLPNTRLKRYLIHSMSWFNFDLFCRTSRKQLCISWRIMQSDWLLCLLSEVWEWVAGRLSEQREGTNNATF